jgi:hypothetical protein
MEPTSFLQVLGKGGNSTTDAGFIPTQNNIFGNLSPNYAGIDNPITTGVAAGGVSDVVSSARPNYTINGITYDGTTGAIVGRATNVLGQQTPTQAPQRSQAEIQAENQRNAARGSFMTGRQNVFDTLAARGASEAGARQLSAQNALDTFRQTQRGVDQQRISNVMGQQQASQGILDMINQGMRNTNVRLSNKNAANSSAQAAAAKAYAAMGAKQQSAANNQFELQNRNIDVAQQGLTTSIEQQKRQREFEKTNLVNGLVDQARQSFITLNDAAAGASIGDRIAIESEKESIRQNLLTQLQEAENYFNAGVEGIQGMGQEAVVGEASRLRAAGQVAPETFMAQAPTIGQGGQGGSPIFNVISNRRRQTA